MDEHRELGREEISQLLEDWANHDPAAWEQFVPIVYSELRRLAHHSMRGERAGHILQTTALVNEVYLRLAGIDGLRWRDRAHFFAMAATLMRRVLVDDARQRRPLETRRRRVGHLARRERGRTRTRGRRRSAGRGSASRRSRTSARGAISSASTQAA
jgi:RNA polymerase sigma factor (TIGR02999 family)